MTAPAVAWQWVTEHYEWSDPPADGSAPVMPCRRCGVEVTWLTKHAAERHGDPIEVVAPVDGRPADRLKW